MFISASKSQNLTFATRWRNSVCRRQRHAQECKIYQIHGR